MEAKDTVKQQIYPQNHEEHLESLQNQAEVSFKAGIKEVVEWMMRYRSETTREFVGFTIGNISWQAKMKEWGIN